MTATSVFNEQQFESKLVSLKDSQEAINSLSSWCLQNREHHKKIVNCWLHCLKRVKIEQRLSLFYLANDVIQYSKRKHYQFVESWGTALQKATTLVRDDKVKSRIMRIFKIWDERGVYDEAFISDLCGLLSTNVKKKTETNTDSSEFQPSLLIGKIRDCKVLEDDTDLRFRKVKESTLELTDADSVRNSLKDRKHGSDIVAEVDHGVKRMEAYVKALELEIAEREKLIDILYQATLFYESQRGEAKIVCNAYRNFGNKVKILKRKLDELIPTLSDSPIPSPDANAPSPSPDSDLELSSQNKSKQNYENKRQNMDTSVLDFSFVNNTFMGNSQIRDISLQRDMFTDTIRQVDNYNAISSENNVRPIEVINTREQKESVGFNITDFLKSLLPQSASKHEQSVEAISPSQPSTMQPLQPPPMPPIFTTNDAFGPVWKMGWEQGVSAPTGGSWNHDGESQEWSVPPTVSESWHETSVTDLNTDTPESPPLYEKEGVSAPVEYDDSMPTATVADVDHRPLLPLGQIQDMDHRLAGQDMDHRVGLPRRIDVDHRKLQKLGPKDVDHRNLISLTGSPRKETKPLQPPPAFVWPADQDYRSKLSDVDFRISQRPSDLVLSTKFNPCQPPPKLSSSEALERKDVNVESIDMDVSEEDEEEPGKIIQEGEDKRVGSTEASFLNQSNMTNFSMSSSFMDNTTHGIPAIQDVDERLKSIFGSGGVVSESKLAPSEYEDESSRSNEVPLPLSEVRNDQSTRESRECDFEKSKSNGFLEDSQDGHDYYRREQSWPADGTSDQVPPPFLGPTGPVARGDFPSRIYWNSPHSRGRTQSVRFLFRPHHPRLELLRPRLSFRSRVHTRGGRW